MCNKCGTSNIHLHFPGVTKQCNCSSNGGGNTPPVGGDYILKPQGGENGNVLVKEGDKVIWRNINELYLEPIYSTDL